MQRLQMVSARRRAMVTTQKSEILAESQTLFLNKFSKVAMIKLNCSYDFSQNNWSTMKKKKNPLYNLKLPSIFSQSLIK